MPSLALCSAGQHSARVAGWSQRRGGGSRQQQQRHAHHPTLLGTQFVHSASSAAAAHGLRQAGLAEATSSAAANSAMIPQAAALPLLPPLD